MVLDPASSVIRLAGDNVANARTRARSRQMWDARHLPEFHTVSG